MKTMSLSTCFFAIAFGTSGQAVTVVDQPALQPPVELQSAGACTHPGEKTDFAVSDWSDDPVYHELLFADPEREEFIMQMTKDAKTIDVIVASPSKWGEWLPVMPHRDGKESHT